MADDEDIEIDIAEGITGVESPANSPNSSKKAGLSTRFKKWGASKTANLKVGRKIITQALGDEGERLFNALTAFLIEFYGKSEGSQLSKDILAIVLKIKILFDEGFVQLDGLKASEELAHSMLFEIRKNFDILNETNDEKVDVVVDVTELSRILFGLRDNLRDFIKGSMTDKNIEKLNGIFNKTGDSKCLDALFNNEKYFKCKVELEESFRAVIQNVHLRDSKVEKTCRYANCTHLAAKSQGLFRSSGYCPTHHADHYRIALIQPYLAHFLYEDEQNVVYLLDYLKKNSHAEKGLPLILYNFLMTLNQWKSISSKNMKIKRAKNICEKFLDSSSSNCLPVNPELREKLCLELVTIESGNVRVQGDFFEPVSQEVMKSMEGYFQKFLKSSDFERFLVATTLPKELQAQVGTTGRKFSARVVPGQIHY